MKGYKIIVLKLLILLLPFYVLCPILIYLFPMRFMDGEYAAFNQNKEISLGGGYNRVLIMGDSVAKASWYPKVLSDDTYNFALYGTAPAEEYYYLREYLQNHEAPQVLIYTQHLSHFMEAEAFWTRSVYFHRISTNDLREFGEELNGFEDISVLEGKDYEQECFLYQTYSPIKYSKAFLKGLLSSKRYEQNKERYRMISKSKGQIQFGTKERSDDVAEYFVELELFTADEVLNSYFKKIIELCEAYNIKFVFQSAPFNESTYERLQDKMISDYEIYMQSLQNIYPDAVINADLFYYDNTYFGDAIHLNKRGAIKFSQEMKEKYKDIFRAEE